MRIGRPIAELSITDDERAVLERLIRRPKTAQALALRARIIISAAGGESKAAVAETLGVTKQTVGKWRRRFIELGVDGLMDEAPGGAPRTISAEDVERVLALTLESKPEDAMHWSTRSMAHRSGLSQSAVSRIWRAFALELHRSETFKLSTDPHFIEKVRDIVGLYLNPPDRALVLCVDEKTQIHGLDHTQPLLPMRPGQIERRTHEYVRHGTSSLFAALTEKQLSHGVFRSTRELEETIMRYIEGSNPNPKPFIWTKTADQILETLARFCTRIYDSGH